MKNLILDIEDVINRPVDIDVWIVFHPEKSLDHAHSLQMLLWDQSFDPTQAVKNYKMKHSTFYKLLFKGEEENYDTFAKANIAFLIN